MKPSIRVDTKKRGRPKTTGKGQVLGVRVHPPQIATLDAWIAGQPEPRPSRPEAIRRLLAKALGEARGEKLEAGTRKRMPEPQLTVEILGKLLAEALRSKPDTRWAPIKNGFELVDDSRGSTSLGAITIFEGRAVFDPPVQPGRDWTSHQWPTPNELRRWLRGLLAERD